MGLALCATTPFRKHHPVSAKFRRKTSFHPCHTPKKEHEEVEYLLRLFCNYHKVKSIILKFSFEIFGFS